MLKIFKKKRDKIALSAPCKGVLLPIENVQDAMFANKLLGDGFAMQPQEDIICAPCSGQITMIAATAHAIGIQLENGAEILIHVGLDTVNLNGKGFTVLVKEHQKVKQGTPLLKVDRVFMKKEKMNLTIPIILINDDKHELEHHIHEGEADSSLLIASVITR